MKALLVAGLMVAVALAGCADDGPAPEENVPTAITRERVAQLEALAGDIPREVSFPGQVKLPSLNLLFEGVLEPGTGATSVEMTRDNSVSEINTEYMTFDLKEHVPEGQPVEINLGLKWHGDPGAGVDMDIYANVPGTHGAYDPDAWNWDFNWNIVNKARVVNTIHVPGEPLEVGMQIANGKILHPEGVQWSLRVQLVFGEDVLAPGVPYAVSAPDGISGFIIESEPLLGEEHVTSSFVIVGPDDAIIAAIRHNDIGTETLFIPARQGGEYVFYAHELHGGFLKVQTDIPNPEHEARILEKTVHSFTLMEQVGSAPGVPGTPLDASASGPIDLSSIPGPLDVVGFVRPSSGAALHGQVILRLASDSGVLHHLEATGNVQGDFGRIGNRFVENPEPDSMGRQHLKATDFTSSVTTNGAFGFEAGYEVISFTR